MNPALIRIATLSINQAFIGSIVVAAFYYFTMFDDGSALDAQALVAKQQIDAERTKEKESDQALSRIKALRESYNALSEQFKVVSTQIPTDLQMSEIIRTVDTMAQTSGIVIKTKEPRSPQREDVLETLPIRVTAEGTFSEIAMFIYNLSTIERIYRVRSFNITGPSDPKGPNKLKIDAELASYRFTGSEPAPSPAGGRKK